MVTGNVCVGNKKNKQQEKMKAPGSKQNKNPYSQDIYRQVTDMIDVVGFQSSSSSLFSCAMSSSRREIPAVHVEEPSPLLDSPTSLLVPTCSIETSGSEEIEEFALDSADPLEPSPEDRNA